MSVMPYGVYFENIAPLRRIARVRGGVNAALPLSSNGMAGTTFDRIIVRSYNWSILVGRGTAELFEVRCSCHSSRFSQCTQKSR